MKVVADYIWLDFVAAIHVMSYAWHKFKEDEASTVIVRYNCQVLVIVTDL